ncbi:hypothetical protein [Microvirga yunnanensis]|nr:hypothetical protein [Microvirga sp. HBU65207]
MIKRKRRYRLKCRKPRTLAKIYWLILKLPEIEEPDDPPPQERDFGEER